MKQYKKQKQTLESAQYGLEISFNEAQSAASPRNIDQKKYPLEPRVAIPVKKREAVIFRFDSPVR